MGAVGLGGRSYLERVVHGLRYSFLTVVWEKAMWPLETREVTEALLILCMFASNSGRTPRSKRPFTFLSHHTAIGK